MSTTVTQLCISRCIGRQCGTCGHIFFKEWGKHKETTQCKDASELALGHTPERPFYAASAKVDFMPPPMIEAYDPKVRAVVLQLLLWGIQIPYEWHLEQLLDIQASMR